MTLPEDVKQKLDSLYALPSASERAKMTDDRYDEIIGLIGNNRMAATEGYSLSATMLAEKEKEIALMDAREVEWGKRVRQQEEEIKFLTAEYECNKDKVYTKAEYDLVESQRKEWSDMCVKKQARIEELKAGLKQCVGTIETECDNQEFVDELNKLLNK